MTKKLLRLASAYLTLLFFNPVIFAQGNINFGSEFNYISGKKAGNLPSAWTTNSSISKNWDSSQAPFYFGLDSEGTELTDMYDNYASIYLISSFTVENAKNIEEVDIEVDYNDGFLMWINGVLVLQKNVPDSPKFYDLALNEHLSGTIEKYTIQAAEVDLVDGENMIAIHVLNDEFDSPDLYFDMQLTADTIAPITEMEEDLVFEHEAGYFSQPFKTSLTYEDPAFKILYTLDGSDPRKSSTVLEYNAETGITIDPSDDTNRSLSPGVTLRASVIQDGHSPSYSITKSYIFLNEVLHQSYPGGDWPTTTVNDQLIDYDMDARVVENPEYAGDMVSAFLDIPTVSIATDLSNLFDETTGIYVNACEKGSAWERDCSVEWLPSDTAGFQINGGIRIRGGWSRHGTYEKHGFRLFFRDRYGEKDLDYPLFGDEGVDEFVKVDLRCAQNYAWHTSAANKNTYLREIFTRDAQGASNSPYTRSRYCHLYLNGMYWGLYMTQERSEANFAESYLGSDKDDYDVVKVGIVNYKKFVDATDGNLDAWEHIYEQCEKGFENDSSYFYLQGLDKNGVRNTEMQVWVDIDNLIDYMINIFYTGNFDGPVSAFNNNKHPNNYYAIFNREKKDGGFKFFVHDGEHTLGVESAPGIGLEENRVNIGTVEDAKMEVSDFDDFHPQWLHFKLSENEKYRSRFADRAEKHLTNNGVYTTTNNITRFLKRKKQIDNAIIAESARWGDAGDDKLHTKNDNWLSEVNYIVNEYFPYRTEVVINQLKEAGLYTEIESPEYYVNNALANSASIDIENTVTVNIQQSNGNGVIYYCTNGEDPKLISGEVNPEALTANNIAQLEINTSTNIKSRVKIDGKWSSLKELTLYDVNQDLSDFKVTELHYHPSDTAIDGDSIGGKFYEFIEFRNISSSKTLNLSDLSIANGVKYDFPDGTLLLPQQYYVVASKPSYFYDRYKMVSSGNFSKNFSNSGENVVVADNQGNVIISFEYSDSLPWPMEADGGGLSLVSAWPNPNGDPNEVDYWVTSFEEHGSPFADDSISRTLHPLAVEQLAANEGNAIRVFPNPSKDKVYIYLENSPILSNLSVRLTNLAGVTVYSGSLNDDQSLSLGQLKISSGTYMLQLFKEGVLWKNEKIIYLQ